jgi:hypothetical protein
MSDSEDTPKFRTPLQVYGYMVVYRTGKDKPWTVDQDDEYRNLPAHYLSVEEALDRVEFLRTKKIDARAAALVAEQSDTAREFEENRNHAE